MNESSATLEPTRTTQPVTKFFIMYGDFQTGVRARHFAEALGARLGDKAGSILALWRCELLELAELAAHAGRDADGSDFVIVSLPGNTSLSFAVKHWLERWIEQAAGDAASLVVLFDPARGVRRHVEAIRFYLRQLASEAGVDFFAHSAITPGCVASQSLLCRAPGGHARRRPTIARQTIPVTGLAA